MYPYPIRVESLGAQLKIYWNIVLGPIWLEKEE